MKKIHIKRKNELIKPESATKSLIEKPLVENKPASSPRLFVANGSSRSAATELGLDVESFLPNSTFQLGPPSYNYVQSVHII